MTTKIPTGNCHIDNQPHGWLDKGAVRLAILVAVVVAMCIVTAIWLIVQGMKWVVYTLGGVF